MFLCNIKYTLLEIFGNLQNFQVTKVIENYMKFTIFFSIDILTL